MAITLNGIRRQALPSIRPTIAYLEGGSQVVEKEVERAIEALLQERRTFVAPEGFAQRANFNDASVYEKAS